MSFLPYPPTSTTAAIEVFRQDVAITHEVVHGSDTATVLTEGGEIPTINKLIKDLNDRIGAGTGADITLRPDLAEGNSTILVGGVPASRLSKTVIQASHLKALPTTGLVDGQQYSVAGFYSGSTTGGGLFVYSATTSKSLHNIGRVLSPESIAAWDGTRGDLGSLRDWSGTDSGCFVSTKNTSEINPCDFGADDDPSVDTGAVVNYIFSKIGATDIIFPHGEFNIATGIQIKRGGGIRGVSTFDNTTGTVLLKSPSLNSPVVATEKFYGGVETHYYSLKNICIKGNRVTKSIDAVMTELLAWWGVFVGSTIDNVFLFDNYGPGVSFEHSYDTDIGLMWVNSCEVGASRALIEIDQQLNNPGGPTGIINISSLYTENAYIATDGGTPRTNPSNRGAAIKAGMIYRLKINSLHQEAVSEGLEITHGTSYNIDIGMHSIVWSGNSIGRNCSFFFNVLPKVFKLGSSVVGNQFSAFAHLDVSSAVASGNQLRKVEITFSRWGGMNFVAADAQGHDIFRPLFKGDTQRAPSGAALNSKGRCLINAAEPLRYHYEKTQGDFWSFGSTAKQASNAEIDFFRLESYGTAGDRVNFLKPFTIPEMESIAFTKAFYITSSGELRIRIGSSTYKVELTAV